MCGAKKSLKSFAIQIKLNSKKYLNVFTVASFNLVFGKFFDHKIMLSKLIVTNLYIQFTH